MMRNRQRVEAQRLEDRRRHSWCIIVSVTETEQTGARLVVHRDRQGVIQSVLAVIVLVTSLIVFLGVVTLILVEDIAMDDAVTACPDPAGASYNAGRPRWSMWPPGSYCDYREVHPEWPEDVAVQQRPPSSRAALLLVTLPAIGLSVVVLLRGSRRRT
jgi:hypothetical protein